MSPNEDARQPARVTRLGDTEIACTREKFVEHHPSFQPCECCSNTEVHAGTESQVPTWSRTVQHNRVRIGELATVTIRRPPQQQQMTSCGESNIAECRVGDDMAVMAAKR